MAKYKVTVEGWGYGCSNPKTYKIKKYRKAFAKAKARKKYKEEFSYSGPTSIASCKKLKRRLWEVTVGKWKYTKLGDSATYTVSAWGKRSAIVKAKRKYCSDFDWKYTRVRWTALVSI